MGTSLTLFRIAGIDVRVHWSFLLIIVYGAVVFGAGGKNLLVGALYGVFVILLLFLCVTLHEFGHALVAKHFKIGVPHITLLPIGGVATLERMPDKPLDEFLIAIAGPLVNFAIALLLIPITLGASTLSAGAGGDGITFDTFRYATFNVQTPGVVNLLIYLIVINLMLGLFNLLPAFPMDGGRILRSLLAMAMSYVQATRVAVFVGRLMAVLFAVWGIFSGDLIMLLIAFFVYVGGRGELEGVKSRSALRNILARDALTPSAVSLYISERIDRAVSLAMTSYQTGFPVLDLGGVFAGVLTRDQLIHGLREGGRDARLVDYMLPAADVPQCKPDDEMVHVWELMGESGSRVVAVIEGRRFFGLITADDIAEMIHLESAAKAGDRRRGAGNEPSEEAPLHPTKFQRARKSSQ